MSDTVIRVENLSKRYRLGHQSGRGDGLRHVLQEKLTALFRTMVQQIKGRTLETEIDSSPVLRTAGASAAAAEDFWALRDVSFEVKRGDVIGIIGRNGAGKSTLLKILSRITEPTSGRIETDGRVASLLEVGTGFHPELTGRENIFLNGAILGMKRAEIRRRFDEIVAFAEVEQFLDTPVKRYSSGMYVRLAFAVAAHLEPEILIVDEVLAVGDVQFQKKCLGKMQDVSKGGRTVLFVSHQLDAVRALCQRSVLLEGGRVCKVGTVDEVIARYTGALRLSESIWNGDLGDKNLRLTRITISQNNMASPFDTNKPLEIRLRLLVKTRISQLALGLTIYSDFGAEILYTHIDDSWPQPIQPVSPGEYEAVFRFPPALFAEGKYLIAVDLGIQRVTTAITRSLHLLLFELHNVSGPGRWHPGAVGRGFHGLIRPRLETELSQLT